MALPPWVTDPEWKKHDKTTQSLITKLWREENKERRAALEEAKRNNRPGSSGDAAAAVEAEPERPEVPAMPVIMRPEGYVRPHRERESLTISSPLQLAWRGP